MNGGACHASTKGGRGGTLAAHDMRATPWTRALLLAALLTQGCFLPRSEGLDSGVGARVTPAPPVAPAAPTLPRLTPCPPGWREVAGPSPDWATTCDPWPAGGRQTCAADQAHFPGEPGCVRIGTACPAGPWPEGLPAGVRVVYAKPGAPAPGSGTQASPYSSLAKALSSASAGTIVALAKGTFAEAVKVPAGVTLWGACVAQSHITPASDLDLVAADVRGPGVTLRNLTLSGPTKGVGMSTPGASVELRDVLVDGTTATGVLAVGAVTITGSRLVIRDTQPEAATGDLGQGLELTGGAQADLSWVALEGNRGAGASVLGSGSSLRWTDVVVSDTRPRQMDGALGRGVYLDSGAQLDADRLALERNHESALWSQDGAQATVRHVVARNTLARPDTPEAACAIGVANGSRLTLRGAFLERNAVAGLCASFSPSFVDAEDLVVRDTLPSASLQWGVGVECTHGALFRGARLSLEGNRTEGLRLDHPGSVVQLEDARVYDTLPQESDGADGIGLAVAGGAKLSATRVVVERSATFGVAAQDATTQLELTDVAVRSTKVSSQGDLGSGLSLALGARASVRRLLSQDNHASGIFVASPGSTADLEDVTVRDTHGEANGQMGEALQVQQGGTVTLRRALFERCHEIGLMAYLDATVTGSEVTVRETLESECPAERCTARGGAGVVSGGSSRVRLERFLLEHNASVGIQVFEDAGADLSDGQISYNPIGAAVSVDGFDVSRLENGVAFENNEVRLYSAFVPLPPINTGVTGMSPPRR